MKLDELKVYMQTAMNYDATDRREALYEKLMALVDAVNCHVEKGIVDPHDKLKLALEDLVAEARWED